MRNFNGGASRLREKLSREQKTLLTKDGTNDPEAYQLYLKGRYQGQAHARLNFQQ